MDKSVNDENALREFCDNNLEHVGGSSYICPFCKSNRGGFAIKGDRWKCFSCGLGGDIVDLMSRMGLDEGLHEMFSKVYSTIAEHTIRSKDILDGLIAYRTMLQVTQEVFGEEAMNDAIICKTIEAASYGMWRSIMGPKFDERKR